MKKITALLLCFLLLCMCSVIAFAAEPEEITNTEILVTVPDCHKITVTAQGAKVFYNGFSGEEFVVERLSEPRLLVRAESGKVLKTVTLNGVDVTELLYGGYLDLSPIYEDKVIEVTTQDELTDSKETYTVKGKVTLNAQPLSGVELEIHPTLNTIKTDKDGNFIFTDIAAGEHTLTVIKDGKVIGYLSFELKKDNKTDISLNENGTYTVSVDKSGIGVDLQLVLNEEKGTLAPTGSVTVQKPESPLTGDNSSTKNLWFVLLISAACIVVLEIYRRNVKNMKA